MGLVFHKTFVDAATGANGFDSVTTTNGTLAHSAGAGLHGTSGGITCTRTANSPNVFGVCGHILSGLAACRTAFYCNIAALTIGTDSQSTLLWSPRTAATAGAIGSVRAIRVAGVVVLECRKFTDAVGFSSGVNVSFTVPPTWIEVEIVRESIDTAANGALRFYFGGGDWPSTGQQVAEFLSVDNYINFNACTNARLGIGSGGATVSGSLLVDEWTMRDDDTPIIYGVSDDSAISRGMKYVLNRRRRKSYCW